MIIKQTGGGQQYKKRYSRNVSYPTSASAVNQSEKIAILYIMRGIYFFTTYFKDLLSSSSIRDLLQT